MINWKLRLKNKTTLLALISALVTFVYTVLATLDIVPSIDQEQVFGAVGIVLSILTTMGVIVDPTTKGIEDSERVKNYVEPK